MVATSAGLAFATVSLTANVQIGLSLPGASGWLAIILAGVISALASSCFTELIGLFPTAAGIKLFVEKAFGERAALLSATLYVGVTILIVGAESYILSQVLSYVLPGVPPWVWAIGFLTVLGALNVRGLQFSGLTQDIATGLMVVGVVALSAWALLRPGAPVVPSPFAIGDGFSFAQAVALGVFLYLGFEWVTPLAEEVTDQRLIPRGMLLGLGVLALVYALLHVSMMAQVDKATLAGSPIPHLLFGEAAFGRWGLGALAIISALASVTSYNAGLLTASRFLYALARDRAAPPMLARIHPDWATPYVAILSLYLVCASMAVYVLITGAYQIFIFLGAAVECLIFVVMALSVLKLRRTMPELRRPFRTVGGVAGALAVAVIYGTLGVLIFLPGEGTDAKAQMLSLGSFIGLTILVWAYATWTVPWMRRRWAPAESGRRRPRRPGA